MIAGVIATHPALAGDFLFPNVERNNPYASADNLKAPFADKTDGEASTHKPAHLIPLHLPHINTASVTQWVNQAVTDVLTFTGDGVDAQIDAKLSYFTLPGQTAYKDFLQTQNIYKNLQSGHYQLNSAVKIEPLLIGEQEAGGRYKWLYEIQVLMSYLNNGTSSYSKTKPQNQDITLSIQVTRVNKSESGDQEILIELWRGQ
jgi:hypothetical protein